MPLDQWQALAGLHSGEAHDDITVSFYQLVLLYYQWSTGGEQRGGRAEVGGWGGGGSLG